MMWCNFLVLQHYVLIEFKFIKKISNLRIKYYFTHLGTKWNVFYRSNDKIFYVFNKILNLIVSLKMWLSKERGRQGRNDREVRSSVCYRIIEREYIVSMSWFISLYIQILRLN